MKIVNSESTGSEWSEPEIVIESNLAVGEPVLGDDNLYFEQIFTDGDKNYHPDLLYLERVAE